MRGVWAGAPGGAGTGVGYPGLTLAVGSRRVTDPTLPLVGVPEVGIKQSDSIDPPHPPWSRARRS